MNIIATKQDGRLFIGTCDSLDSKAHEFGKSINTYNNFLTKFVTKILKLSTDLEIGGKIRTVNIKSLAKHLKSVGSEHYQYEEHLAAYKYDELIEGITNSSVEVFGATFSEKKRHKLTLKMLNSLVADDQEGVRKQLKKGASGIVQFTLDQKGRATLHAQEMIKRRQTVKIYSPLSYAVDTKKIDMAGLIKRINGRVQQFDTIITHEKGQSRKIQMIKDDLSLAL